MSKIKVQQPVVHIPNFREYSTTADRMRKLLTTLGLEMPMGMLDSWYYYTDMEGWGKVLYNLVFSSSLYKADRFDCPMPQDLAFAMGLFFADGSCGFSNNGGWWSITNTNIELLERCIRPLQKEWGFNLKVMSYPSEQAGQTTNYGIRNKALYHLQTDIGRGNKRQHIHKPFIQDFWDMFYIGKQKKVPGCILESPLEIKREFLLGVIEGDGYKAQHKIGIHGRAGLRGLYLLASDLGWKPYILPEKRREDFWYLGYSFRNQYDAFILRYLEDKNWVSTQELANEFNLTNMTMQSILGGIEKDSYITSRKLWSQRKDVKLIKQLQPHCENYALKAMNTCAERYGLNTLAMVIGDTPQGRHGFNIFFYGDGFMLFEPNASFDFSMEGAFEIGEHGYKPELVLI